MSHRSVHVRAWLATSSLATLALLVSATSLSAAQDAGSPGAAVPMYRGDAARTGVMPGPGPVGVPDRVGVPGTPRGDGNVYAIDPATGIGRVQLTTGGHIGSPLVVVGETLYVGSGDGRVHAVDRTSGNVLWSRPFDAAPLSSVAADGRLIVGTELGQLVASVEAPHA